MKRLIALPMNSLKSERLGPIVSICCGIITLIALYLSWVIVPLYDSYTLSFSGWRLIIWAESIGYSFTEPYLVMFGGILMLVCGLPLLVRSVTRSNDMRMNKALAIGATAGAALATIGVLWFLIRSVTSGESGSMGSGFYLCIITAVLGLIPGVTTTMAVRRTAVKYVGKQQFRDISPLIALVSGTAVLLGVFLPWLVQSVGGITSSVSGWALTRFDLTGASNPQPLLVMAGSMLMIICGILLTSSDFSSLTSQTSLSFARKVYRSLGVVIYTGGALVIGGAIWFVVSATGELGAASVGYGIYIIIIGAFVGALSGIRNCMQTKRRVSTTQTSRVGI